MTEKLQVTKPTALLATQETVVVPSWKVEPDGGVQVTFVAPPVVVGVG